LPLSFEANHGQTDSRVKFLSRTSGYSLFLTGDEAVLVLRNRKPACRQGEDWGSGLHAEVRLGCGKASGVLRMKLRNANPAARVTGLDELAGTSNYFIGNDPAKWRAGVPTYAKVKYEGIYSGIDLVYYGNQRQLEYDFIVVPGADPRRIAFEVSGAKRIRRDAQGDLVLTMKTGEDEIRWHKPVVYQEKDGARQLVAANYAITDKNRVGFEVAKYDARRPLYIDPLIYSTYLGGSGGDLANGIAVDSAGNAYVVGFTCSTDFPTMNPLQPNYAGGNPYCGDAFVTKLNPTGTALVYSTYLGGSNADDGLGIAVDSAGNAYVIGFTYSTDFPVTPGAFQTVCNGGSGCSQYGDAFVAKINAAGSALVYSTYLGGNSYDTSSRAAVDSSGNAYVTGQTSSTDFPTTPGAFQTIFGGRSDAFVTKFNPSGSALVYSTYLGGSLWDEGSGIAVDSAGNAYVTGATGSADFPTMNPLQPTFGGGYDDAFVSKLNSTGSQLVYSTYLGGSGQDGGASIAVDGAHNAYITGGTSSTNFPVTPGAFQTACPLNCRYESHAFVTKVNATESALSYSTYLGGNFAEGSSGIAVDSAGNAYVTGVTNSANFPTTPGAIQRKCNGGSYCAKYGDAFVTKFNPKGSALAYSTYLGGSSYDQGRGIAVDSAGNSYVTGVTDSSNFPTKNAFQATNAGIDDAFVAKIQMLAATTTTLSSSPNPSTHGQAVTFTAVVTSGLGPPPDGEIVTFKKGTTVLGTGTLSGGSASFTTSALPVGTNYIRAVYGGDSNFAGSKSKAVAQVVN